MKILVIGGGGREHALCWKLSQSPKVDKIYCVPGNAGISEIAECRKVEYEKNFLPLVQLAREEGIDFTVVGPEVPLVNGIVDYFQKRNLAIFGPSKKAALLEGSKVFAKRFMRKYSIPTADFKVFSDPDKAIEYIKKEKAPKVIKADGLAAGKGSLVTNTKEEAIKAIELIMKKRAFGKAGEKIVVEERLRGKEISFFVLTDGKTIKPLVSSQDHKRVYDGDKGPNTGGMGAYSPAPLTPSLYNKILKKIVIPTLEGMRNEGREYKGVLYLGLMIERGEPKVLEFNVRFGDPETQVILPRLKSDLLEVLLAVYHGDLHKINLEWRSQAAVCVILASGGYPDKYEKGKQIKGLENLSRSRNIFPFYAGVSKDDGKLITNGGRVIGITALAKDLKEAIREAYRVINKVYFEGIYYRKDIGYKGLTKKIRRVK
ncbi:phosphoribosylamine--glycine ligase [Candidatus Aerophobetes bacterium]|uniref:Phosphoribosylamine--glycine ligase n=1 Tax=Aerophobetes bacterium TaxID=2030807 RepID=A0A662D3B0_UNCAE|nr:MAG: phosphoribosylamine--glycine ligase [Candidatus Aerophobetes bacterium]